MEIDNLSIGLKVNGADQAIQNILSLASAVEKIATGVGILDSGKLSSFASGLGEIKKSIPTSNQAENMSAFAMAMDSFVSAISGASITQVASDMSNLSGAVQGMGTRSVSTLKKATQAMHDFAQQSQQAAKNASPTVQPKPDSANYQQSAERVAQAYRQVNQELTKTAISADSMGGKLQKIGAIVPTNKFKTLTQQLESVRRKYDELRERMNTSLASGKVTPDSKEFQRWSRELEGLRNDYDQLILQQRELALAGGGFKLNPTVQAGLDGFKKGFNGVINVIKGGFVSAIKTANKSLSAFVKNITGANSAQKALQKTMSSLKSMPEKIAKEITRLGKMLKLMVTRMALRAVIKDVGEGFKSLAIHSDQFNESMSSVINASKQLGYSFAAMVSPLINALAPAIVYIINLLTKLLNVINQVFSALTGASSWNKAKSFTDSWRDSFDKTGKSAGKTAKELKKTVLGFDELNQLQDNKNSGGGGGGADIADMFETMKIDPKWKEFADWIKQMWKDKDFTDLGKLLGTKLRDWLESIPWDEIRKTSNDLGKCLATLINGLVEVERLGYDIGYTVAQGVNTIFEFINGFVHNLHWDSIGKFIADTFNGFFETIDWDLIKDTVVTGLKGLAEAIQNFIDTFHWDNISDFIIKAVDTIVSGIKAFVEGINWGDLGKKLGNQLTKTIKGINWKEVGQALGEVLGAIVEFAYEFFSQLRAEDIVKAVTDFLHGVFEKVDSKKLGQTLAKIFNLIVESAKGIWKANKGDIAHEIGDFFKGLFEDINKVELAKIVGGILTVAVIVGIESMKLALAKMLLPQLISRALFGGAGGAAGGAAAGGAAGSGLIGSATVAGSSMASALVGGILAFLGGSEVGKKIGELIFPEDKDLYEKYEGVKGTFQLYGDFFKTLGEEIADNVGRAWDKVKEKTGELKEDTGNKLKDAAFNFADFGFTVVAKINDVKKSISDLTDNASEKLKSFNDSVAEKVNSVKEKFGELGNNIKEKKDSIVETFTSLDEKAKEKFENLKTKLTEFGEKWAEKWADAKTKLDEFKENSSTTLENMKESFTTFKDKIAEAFSKENWTFSGVADGLKETFENAKAAIKGVWNSVATIVNGEHEVGDKKIKINLPKFATGGFPEDGLFMANRGELVGSFPNGKTAVANNTQIVEGIQSGVYNAVMSAMSQQSGGSSYISNEIILDGEVVARSITKAQEKMNRRYSPQTV